MGPRPGLDLTTSSISCTPSVPSSTGTSVRVWKKASSPRPVRILPPSKRTTKRSVSTPSKVKPRRVRTSTKHSTFLLQKYFYWSEVTVSNKKTRKKKKKKKKKKKS